MTTFLSSWLILYTWHPAHASEPTRWDVPASALHGFMGTGLGAPTAKLAAALGGVSGTTVRSVMAGSPAEAAGLKVGDVLVTFDEERIESSDHLVELASSRRPGTEVLIDLIRLERGKPSQMTVTLTLGTRPGGLQSIVKDVIGRPPPPLNVTDLSSGEPVTLASLQGQVVLLDFWATWCGPCVKAVPSLSKLQRAYRERGFTIVGISDEPASVQRAFTKRHEVTYRLTVAPNAATTVAYRIPGLPTAILLDRSGNVSRVFVGPADEEEVKQAVQALLPGQP